MEVDIKKLNIFGEYCGFLASCKGDKKIHYNNVRKLIAEKQAENVLIEDIEDTFTIKEYISKFYGKEVLEDKQKFVIIRNSVTRTFLFLSNEDLLSDYLKTLEPKNKFVVAAIKNNKKITFKSFVKEVYGSKTATDEQQYNEISDDVYEGFIAYIDMEIKVKENIKINIENSKPKQLLIDKYMSKGLSEKQALAKGKKEHEHIFKKLPEHFEKPFLQPLKKSWRFLV